MKLTSAAIAMAFAFSGYAYAQEETQSTEAQTKLKIEDTKEKNKVDGDIDNEITNARMRAESGSKSKYSLSAGVSYTGGKLDNAFGTERPNLSGEPGNQEATSANIDVSVRYRWTKNDSLTFGTSIGMYTPFQGNVSGGDQMNVSDPSIGYSRVGKLGALQTSADLGAWAGTSQESRGIGNDFGVSAGYTLLHSFESGWTAGVAVSGSYRNYTDKPGDYLAKPKLARARAEFDAEYGSYKNFYGGDPRTQFNLGLFPFAEYTFNDTYSFRTVFGYFNWNHLYGDANNWRLLQTYVYQSAGVGISVTRDIYLYPNIQFVPDNIRSDFTNVAMSATLNVF